MRIIHTADLHLDSKMTANLSKEKAKMRKTELLNTFVRMVEYAAKNDVEAILIAGDLFDTKVISATALNVVKNEITSHPDIDFYYIKGNHDKNGFYDEAGETVPENLKLFNDEWTCYELSESKRVKLYGIELTEGNSARVQEAFSPDPYDINIVMMHGQESEAVLKDKAEIINLKLFKNKGINYLALGHIHEYKCEPLDGEGKYCYCGCLEGRGFDECGDHGFVLLTVDEEKGTVTDEFVSFASRRLYEVDVDITGLSTTPEILAKTESELSNCGATDRDLVKIVLKGSVDVECEKEPEYIVNTLKDNYFFLKLYDESKLSVDYDSYMLDESLKGEFVRLVIASDLSDEEKANVIKQGIYVISGGKLEV